MSSLLLTPPRARVPREPRQGRASDLKAELRALLLRHGVRSMRVVPVKRNYAFEDPGVAHGEQWVLKVRARWGSGPVSFVVGRLDTSCLLPLWSSLQQSKAQLQTPNTPTTPTCPTSTSAGALPRFGADAALRTAGGALQASRGAVGRQSSACRWQSRGSSVQ